LHAYLTAPNCSGANAAPAGASTNSPVTTGTWTPLSGQAAISDQAQSLEFIILFFCTVICPKDTTVNFDDAVAQTEPLTVTMSSLSARRSHKGVLLRWRTGTEVDELGFNVYRQQGNRRVRVNRRVLPALGGVSGRSYSFTDGRAPRHRALRYWLQDVDRSGARTWHGPVRVAAS
jgi:hypothetical protein